MIEALIRVTSIRSQNPTGFGGCIFSGVSIDEHGVTLSAVSYFVVKATGAVLGMAQVQKGQWWKVSGEPQERLLDVNGYQVAEMQINASQAVLTRPSGEHIISFLAENPAFERVGQVKARKLWEKFGNDLYEIFDSGNVALLATVLSYEISIQVVGEWSKYGDSRTLQWLQLEGLPLDIGRKVLKFFGRETPEKLKEDPYRLLSFCASWWQVDNLALKHFQLEPDDPRRLNGAIEEACYRLFATGHTIATSSILVHSLQSLLGKQTDVFRWRNLIPLALSHGSTNGSYVVDQHGIQPLGAMVMEREVAKAVIERLSQKNSTLMPASEVDEILNSYEHAEGIQLNVEQRKAVHTSAEKSFVLITGGAGVGKTTVLKAIYKIYDQVGIKIVQLALAGRAAKRMHEATGRSASTIASFLKAGKELTEVSVVVLDEASMIDLVTMYRLLELLPNKVRIVLAGDPEQLMPVGPGLVMHALIKVDFIPLEELRIVKRFGGDIALAASSIRNGIWPSLTQDSNHSISFVNCLNKANETGINEISQKVLDLFQVDPVNTQILCARRGGPDGVKVINSICQSALTSANQAVMVRSFQHDAMVLTGFHVGDTVLCTRNMWDRGLQNGSLGKIVEIEKSTAILANEDTEVDVNLAWVLWDDGERRPITESMLDDLELGFAITVHKAQGSQWERIIVPVSGHRLLDRTMIYTAITRAQKQVVIVGDAFAAKTAVEGQPRVRLRQVALDLHVMNLVPVE